MLPKACEWVSSGLFKNKTQTTTELSNIVRAKLQYKCNLRIHNADLQWSELYDIDGLNYFGIPEPFSLKK